MEFTEAQIMNKIIRNGVKSWEIIRKRNGVI